MNESSRYSFLEQLQGAFYAQLGEVPLAAGDERRISIERDFGERMEHALAKEEEVHGKEHADALRDELNRQFKDVPTKYENPITYKIINRLFDRINAAAIEHNVTSGEPPIFGTLPSGRVNAMALSPTNDSQNCIVLFETEFFAYVNLFSKVLAQGIPLKDGTFSFQSDDIKAHLSNESDALNRLRELVTALLLDGRPRNAPQYFLLAPRSTIAGIFLDAVELFVMGHEYAHVALGHLTKARSMTPPVQAPEVFEILPESWQAEYEADALGAMLAIRASAQYGSDTTFAALAPIVFFECIKLVTHCASVIATGDSLSAWPISQTHPPPDMRWKSIETNVIDKLPAEVQPKGLVDSVRQILDILRMQLTTTLEEIHASGAPLSPRWLGAQ